MAKTKRPETTYTLTTSDAAALLGVDAATIRAYTRKGVLPAPHRLDSGQARYSIEQLLPSMPPDIAAQYLPAPEPTDPE